MGNKAGIDFLNQGGFLKWRLEELSIIPKDSWIDMDARYSGIILPWLNIGGKPAHFKKLDALKDLTNYYEGLERTINIDRRAKLAVMNEEILTRKLEVRAINVTREAENKEPLAEPSFAKLEDLKHIPVDPELEEFAEYLKSLLQWASSILLGISFDNPDDNKTLVINKPILMDTGKTRTVYKGGGFDGSFEDPQASAEANVEQ